eukprot:Sspe_Gene.21097::Locus_7853_Transcript_1_1_Confidence_1.000_Length_904::g.21097::m.21097
MVAHRAWVGGPPTKRFYDPVIELLTERRVNVLCMVIGVAGLVLLSVGIASIKGVDNFEETVCTVLAAENSTNPTGCVYTLNDTLGVTNCTTAFEANSTVAGEELPCGLLTVGGNTTCYLADCDEPAFLENPDPPPWATPNTAEVVLLALGSGLTLCLPLGLYGMMTSFWTVSKTRKLPF